MSNKVSVGGRPSKYQDDYPQRVLDFFNRPAFDVLKDDDGNVLTDKNGKPVIIPVMLPTKEGFAISIGVHRSTVWDWEKKHPEFSDAIKRGEDMQKEILIQNGLRGGYDKTFAIFIAKNVTDLSDQPVQDKTPTTYNINIVNPHEPDQTN